MEESARQGRHHQQTPVSRRITGELAKEDQRGLDEVISFCFDAGTEGWKQQAAKQAIRCITPEIYNSLFKGQRAADCRALAEMAKSILAGKEKLHKVAGGFGAWLSGEFGGNPVERAVARALYERIHIPGADDHANAVARSLQIIGIVLCIGRGLDLRRCQCFIDLSYTEAKEKVKDILVAATDDWCYPDSTHIAAWASQTAPRGSGYFPHA